MPSNKEVLDAQRYNRKRLITAFMSGTPGGRELEPKGYIYPLVIGVVLSAVIVAVGVVIGRFAPTLPDGWENGRLIVVDTGARYFTANGTLRPVTNVTSARLLTGNGVLEPIRVAGSVLDNTPRGPQIGIVGAPDDVPPPDRLRADLWTVCLDEEGNNHAWVAGQPARAADAGMTIVATPSSEKYLVAGGKKYLIADEYVETGLLAGVATHPEKAGWLNLLETGDPLAPIRLSHEGEDVTGFYSRLGQLRVGSLLVSEDTNEYYVVTGDKTMAALTPVQYELLKLGTAGIVRGTPQPISAREAADLLGNGARTNPEIAKDWPATLPTAQIDAEHLPCVTLTIADSKPVVSVRQLAVDDLAVGAPAVTVPGGYGALVRKTSGTMGAVQLVADTGQRFGLGADPSESLTRLGYTAADVVNVPGAWVDLIPDSGVELSKDAEGMT